MAPRSALAPALALVLGAAACSDDEPADLGGTYTIVLTNRDNGCNLTNWEVGRPSDPVAVVITQAGADVTVDVQGLAGSALDFVLGSHAFDGSVSGHAVTATITGTRAQSQGACAYTYDATIEGTLSGDNLNGRVLYQARTNQAADCGTLTGCTSFQDFAGARPPR